MLQCVLWGESGGGYSKLGNNGSLSLDAVITAVLLEIAKFLIKKEQMAQKVFIKLRLVLDRV